MVPGAHTLSANGSRLCSASQSGHGDLKQKARFPQVSLLARCRPRAEMTGNTDQAADVAPCVLKGMSRQTGTIRLRLRDLGPRCCTRASGKTGTTGAQPKGCAGVTECYGKLAPCRAAVAR